MVTKSQVLNYFHKNKVCKRKDMAKYFDTYPNLISRLLKDEEIIYDLNDKQDKCFTIMHTIEKEFDSYGLCIINGRVFSKFGKIKPTIISLVNSSASGLKIITLNKMLKTDTRVYLRELTKNGQIFRARIKKADIYLAVNDEKRMEQIRNNEDEIIMDINVKKTVSEGIHLLDESDPVLRDLEIIRQVKSGQKKIEVAKKFNISPKTIGNLCKRFEKNKTKGLIRTRKLKILKISSIQEAAIIAETVQHPQKTAQEIKQSLQQLKSVTIKAIELTVEKAKKFAKLQKKLVLEIK